MYNKKLVSMPKNVINVFSKSDITNSLVMLKETLTVCFDLYDAKQVKSQKYYSKHLRNKYTRGYQKVRRLSL